MPSHDDLQPATGVNGRHMQSDTEIRRLQAIIADAQHRIDALQSLRDSMARLIGLGYTQRQIRHMQGYDL